MLLLPCIHFRPLFDEHQSVCLFKYKLYDASHFADSTVRALKLIKYNRYTSQPIDSQRFFFENKCEYCVRGYVRKVTERIK